MVEPAAQGETQAETEAAQAECPSSSPDGPGCADVEASDDCKKAGRTGDAGQQGSIGGGADAGVLSDKQEASRPDGSKREGGS